MLWIELPLDCQLYIISFLEEKTICNLIQTCKKMKLLLEDNIIWRNFWKKRFENFIIYKDIKFIFF